MLPIRRATDDGMTSQSTEQITPATDAEAQTLLAVSGAHLVSHLHMMVLPVLLPLLKERLQVGYFELGLALTTFSVVTGLTQAPMGFLVDRIGGKRVLIAGLLLGGFAFASLAFNSSYAWLIAAALLAGLANCVYHPADYAILTDGVRDDRMGRAFSIHTFAGFLGGAIAPPLLLGLAALGGLGAPLICAGLVAWAAAALMVLVPDQQEAVARRRAEQTIGASETRKVLTPAVLALTVFFTLLALSHNALFSFSAVALIAGHGLSLAAATAGLTAYLVGSAAGVLAGGVLADKTRRHGDVAALGFAISALITLAIALLSMPFPVLIAAMAVTGFLIGIVQPSRDMLVRKAAPPGAAGRVFGIVSTGFNLGGIFGPLLFGWLLDSGAPRWVFGAAVVFMAATALFAFLEDRRPYRRPGPA
jgi:MFS transporter, FSR family, fosmidomycin resistance protein